MCRICNFTELTVQCIDYVALSFALCYSCFFFYYFGGSLVQDRYSSITQIIVHQRIVIKFGWIHVSIWNSINYLYTENLHVKFKWRIMWNFRADQCEFTCETACEMQVKMCVKGLTSLHTLFTHFSRCNFSHVWNMSVKFMWKTCETNVKNTHYSHIFSHDFSHTYRYS